MRFLPVAHRELLAAGRRKSTWTWRCLYFAITLSICIWAYLDSSYASMSRQGGQVFEVMVGFMAFYAGIAGVHATSDAFGWEKREGTLGLLFLTDLSGWDVVAGKGVAKALNSFYGLLAMLPLLSVPLLLGGVTGGQVVRTSVILIVIMLESLAIGLWVSSRSVNERKSIMATLGMVLLLFLGPFFGAVLAGEAYGWSEKDVWQIGIASPLFGLVAAQFVGTGVSPNWPSLTWLGSVGFAVAVTGLCLVSASRHLPHSWSPELLAHYLAKRASRKRVFPTLTAPLRWPGQLWGWIGRIRLGWDEKGRIYFSKRQRRLLDVHPYVWLMNRVADKRAVALGVTIAVAAMGGYSWLSSGPMLGAGFVFYCFVVVLAWLLRIWMLAEPIMRLAEDRKSGALELVMVTPQQGPEILAGVRQSMRRQFGWPVGLVAALALTVCMVDFSSFQAAGDAEWRALLLMTATALVVDFFALQWIGPWLGITSRSVTTALVAGVGLSVAPGTVWWVTESMSGHMNTGLMRQLQHWSGEWWRWYFIGIWFAVTLMWVVAAWGYRRFIWPRSVRWRWVAGVLLLPPGLLTLLLGYRVMTALHLLSSTAPLREWTHLLLMGVVIWCWARPTLEHRFRDLATGPHTPSG